MAPIKTHADVPGSSPQLRDALRGAAWAHKENGPRFALAESDVDDAVATLTNAGFAVERPPEDWLFKARSGDTVVDVLHRLNGVRVESSTGLRRAARGVGHQNARAAAHDGSRPATTLPRRALLRLREAAFGRARRA